MLTIRITRWYQLYGLFLDPDTQQVQGVVLIDLKLRVIAEATKDARLGKSGYLTVIDENGKHLFSNTILY
ncbi:hypothetical protein GCM10020331_099540 [Ectobacillus funiculus]